MIENDEILQNFQCYDLFLSKLSPRDKEIATSLKMMYSVHMYNNKVDKKPLFLFKQTVRFIYKLLKIPFSKAVLLGVEKDKDCAILKNTDIEERLSQKMNISLVSISEKMTINQKTFLIYAELFPIIGKLFRDKDLNKKYILALCHRMVDYLVVYHTMRLDSLKVVLIENDRTPINVALVHKSQNEQIKTIKYDNWLIDPINHNDVYCEYYFYPSLYHRHIIESFVSNKILKYIEGGFMAWDALDTYQKEEAEIPQIVYFTQFGILPSIHARHIEDIKNIMDLKQSPYTLIVKIHPRETISEYQHLLENTPEIEILDKHTDTYKLIANSDFCFSMFSTISLESKHILEHSYFINYEYKQFDIVDYDALKLDVIKDKKTLSKVLNDDFIPVSQKDFIQSINCTFPNSMRSLQKACDDLF